MNRAAEGEFGMAVSEVGASIRIERNRQELSVQELSRRSGVSFGLISQLERGIGNPSLQSLLRLGDALGVPLPKLLGSTDRDSMVVRADERTLLPAQSAAAGPEVRRERLTPPMQGNLLVIRSTVPARFSNEDRPFRHLGTESVVIESGELLVVHGERRERLSAGDAMTYGCSTPHWWANETDADCVVLGTFTPIEA